MSIEIRYTSKNQKRYKVRVDYKGKRFASKTFVKHNDAVLYERNALSELQKTGHIKDHSAQAIMTLSEALNKYRDEVSINKKSYVSECSRVKIFKQQDFANKSLIQVSSRDIAQFIKDRTKLGNTPSTIQKYVALLQHLFNIARKEWGMESLENPCFNVTKPKTNNARERRLEHGEEDLLLDALKDSQNIYIEYLAIIAIETAMRKGEILNLKWRDINLQERTVFLAITKNGSSRTVPLSSRAIKAFKDIEDMNATDGYDTSAKSCVFHTTSNAILLAFRRATKKANLENLHFHDLRHEATSRLSKTFNVLELARITGHKDTKMLMRYYHADAAEMATRLQ